MYCKISRLGILVFWGTFQCFFGLCVAQETCYPPGGVAGIVIATIVVTAVVFGLGTAAAWRYWKSKKAPKRRDSIRPKQPSQKAQGDFAFDNPYFKDQENDETDLEKGKTRSSLNKNSLRAFKSSDPNSKSKKARSGKNNFIFGGKKHRALDDSCLTVEPERTIVALRGHDFTGLGFNICGNMRDGILVKDVLHRGPASESGLIKAGDKIISVTVSFTNIVYEDALTILSYASPYDVQLELERIPDKSRVIPASPSTSKRLGSCSFNNSGQKLFHPLYRSQSIDDLTQIDRDTYPSHGPRRSQSVGVAAHKLAAHFKNSDSKLEESTERSPASIILSTTGSLNEKMLANVMADGALHKNGLQWEKRFEDTLEGDATSGKILNKQMKKKQASTFEGDVSDASSGKKSHNFIKKNQDFRDVPYKGKLQEFHPSQGNSKHDESSKTTVQVHQAGKGSSRVKTLTEASQALWQLDQSIKDGEASIDESSGKCVWNSQKDDIEADDHRKSALKSSLRRMDRRENGNDSDASQDSLEYTGKKQGSKKSKQNKKHQKQSEKSSTPETKGYSHQESKLGNSYSPQQHIMRRNDQIERGSYNQQANDKHSKAGFASNSERIYANNVHENKPPQEDKHATKERDLKSRLNQDVNNEYREHHQTIVYANQRDVKEKASNSSLQESENFSGKSNGRSFYEESNLESSLSGSKNSVNRDTDPYGNRYVMNSKCGYPQKNPQLSFQRQLLKADANSDSDLKASETKSKSKTNHKEASAKPAGTFTQINPFQQPGRQKNAVFKPWNKKEDAHGELSVNGNDVHYFSMPSSNGLITTTDSSEQRMRRDNSSELLSYTSRSGEDISKTVLITSYDSNNRSSSNIHSNFHNNSHMRQIPK